MNQNKANPTEEMMNALHMVMRVLGQPQPADATYEQLDEAWRSSSADSQLKDQTLIACKEVLRQPRKAREEVNVETLFVKQTPIPSAFLEVVMQRFPTVTFRDNEEIWTYMDGRYIRGNSWQRAYVESLFARKGRTGQTTWITDLMGALKRSTFGERSEFGANRMLCLLNGTYDMISGNLRPHDPENRLLVKLPINYDPDARCPRWESFLMEAIPEERDRDTLQELFGYSLEPGNPHQRMVMLIGPKRSGKSTILRVWEAMIGPENVSHQTLQSLSVNRFSASHLYGKLLNTFADLPARVVNDLGILKSLSGEDAMDVERKGKDFFRLAWGGKAVFSCNELPELSKLDEAFFRRWLCISVPSTVDPAKIDPELTTRLVGELPGIFNWALAGLSRLDLRGRFDPSVDEGGIKQLWLDTANPMRRYVRERIVIERGVDTATSSLYTDYLDWADQAAVDPSSERSFSQTFQRESKCAPVRVRDASGKQSRGFRGLRLRKDGDSPLGQTTLE
jgi:putative DNA primase/helicase